MITTSTESTALLAKIAQGFERISAAEVADLLLSPRIAKGLFLETTREPGPTMWIVNRSDVYDETLRMLQTHSLEDMARRASDKLRNRSALTPPWAPPELETPLNEVPDTEVEDVLGHPLAPFEAMLFFARALNEDHRASAALSLTRRLIEHPAFQPPAPEVAAKLREVFGRMLLEDPSPFARAYAARVPLLEKSTLQLALASEKNAFTAGKILQHPAITPEILEDVAHKWKSRPEWNDSPFFGRVLALDASLPSEARKAATASSEDDALASDIHEWYFTQRN